MIESEPVVERCDLLCLDLPRAEALRAAMPDQVVVERQAREAKAISDPTRLTVARVLEAGDELCVCDLSWILGRSENLVSHHLKVLRTEGLVTSRREGKMVIYSLTSRGQALLDVVAAGQSMA